MQSLHYLRAFADDMQWPDRDRVLSSADAPALAGKLATQLAGPPGLAFGAALGLALAERLLAARFGRSLVDHRTWLIAGQDELAAGTSHEAAAVAGALALGRLTVIAALPEQDGPALARFAAVGWTVRRVMQGDLAELEAALSAAARAQKPTLIATLRRPESPPAETAELAASAQSAGARRAWLKRLRRHAAATAFHQAMSIALPGRLPGTLAPDGGRGDDTPLETISLALPRLLPAMPELVSLPGPGPGFGPGPGPGPGGADPVWSGRHQAASGALLGVAMHGGLLPIGWFPGSAADALLPSRRQAARMGLKLVHILAGPGPAGLAAPEPAGVPVFQPCSAAEALDCLALALRWPGPAILALHDEAVASLKAAPAGASAKGGYRVAGAAAADAAILAGGADLGLALAVRTALAGRGLEAAVISVPCRYLFAAQGEAWLRAVTGNVPAFGLAPDDSSIAAGCTMLDSRHQAGAEGLAARIERRLRRSPDILDPADPLLESATNFD